MGFMIQNKTLGFKYKRKRIKKDAMEEPKLPKDRAGKKG